MKLRILGNSIRLRLSQKEVAQLAASQACNASLTFPNAQHLIYRLVVEQELRCEFMDQTITISLPQSEVSQWADSDQVSIRKQIPLEKGDNLSILVEKDFKCLTDRGEDEHDLFPNPKESH